jgi:hypothetical protein
MTIPEVERHPGEVSRGSTLQIENALKFLLADCNSSRPEQIYHIAAK